MSCLPLQQCGFDEPTQITATTQCFYCIFSISVALAQNTTGITTATTIAHASGKFWGPCTPSTASKTISACLGGCCPSIWRFGVERKASCGALGDHFRWRWPWSAMVVLVDVGRWRLTSDLPTVGIVNIVYQSIFLILCRSHTFSTSDPSAKKGRLKPSKLVVLLFLMRHLLWYLHCFVKQFIITNNIFWWISCMIGMVL